MFGEWFKNIEPIKSFGELIGGAFGAAESMQQEATVASSTQQQPKPVRIQVVSDEPEYAVLEGEWQGTNYDPYDVWQNRPDATEENVGVGAAGVRIGENMAAVSRKKGSDEAMLRLGTVLREPESGEMYLVADLMNRRFDGQNKLDFATPNTGKEISEKYNRTFSGLEVVREGGGYEDVRNFVESGEWDKMRGNNNNQNEQN